MSETSWGCIGNKEDKGKFNSTAIATIWEELPSEEKKPKKRQLSKGLGGLDVECKESIWSDKKETEVSANDMKAEGGCFPEISISFS